MTFAANRISARVTLTLSDPLGKVSIVPRVRFCGFARLAMTQA